MLIVVLYTASIKTTIEFSIFQLQQPSNQHIYIRRTIGGMQIKVISIWNFESAFLLN